MSDSSSGAPAPFNKEWFGGQLRGRLASNRDLFVIDKDAFVFASVETAAGEKDFMKRQYNEDVHHKLVSRAALTLLLDFCIEDWPGMTVEQYAAGMFHGREAREGETLFDLLPEVRERLSADRLGLGHIYGSGTK